MRALSFILFIVASQSTFLQNDELGIGVVSWIDLNDRKIIFYEDTIERKIMHEIIFDTKKGYGPYYTALTNNNWLIPTQPIFTDSNGTPVNLDLFCLQQKGDWCCVKINPKENLWIHRSENAVYSRWDTYLKSRFCIRRISSENRVYKSNDTLSGSINSKKYDCVHVIEVRDYWLKVKPFMNEHGEMIDKDDGSFGWIQWRNKDSLLINYYDN